MTDYPETSGGWNGSLTEYFSPFFHTDNAYDPDVSASQLFIDVEDKFGEKCLIFMDDGNGMTPEKLHKMLRWARIININTGICKADCPF